MFPDDGTMEHAWDLQMSHMSRGCLSDPKDVALFRITKYEQLRGNKSAKAKLPVYQVVKEGESINIL